MTFSNLTPSNMTPSVPGSAGYYDVYVYYSSMSQTDTTWTDYTLTNATAATTADPAKPVPLAGPWPFLKTVQLTSGIRRCNSPIGPEAARARRLFYPPADLGHDLRAGTAT